MTPHFRTWTQRQFARHRYRRGLSQIRKGNLTDAVSTLEQALPDHPRPAEIHISLGTTLWQLGETQQALDAFTQAIATDYRNPKAYGNRGLLHYELGDESLALADWAEALQHPPQNALIYYNRGLLYLQRPSLELALADFTQALKINPNLAEAYLHRGNVKEALGDVTGAIADWELALCNDLRLEQARQRLQQHRAQRINGQLAHRLVKALNLKQLSVNVRFRAQKIEIEIRRPKGVGVNYITLPDTIRKCLAQVPLAEVRQFHLIAYGADQSFPEWQQQCDLYRNLPCPPTHWRTALLTALLIFPPLGIPALVYAFRVKEAYQQGEYPEALRASKTAKALCITGGVITTTLLVMILGYLGFLRLKAWRKGMEVCSTVPLTNPTPDCQPAHYVDGPTLPETSAHISQRVDESRDYFLSKQRDSRA